MQIFNRKEKHKGMTGQLRLVTAEFLFCTFFCFLTACTTQDVSVTLSSQIYYVTVDETRVVSEGYDAQEETTEALVEEFIAQLDRQPVNSAYRMAKPQNVQILDYSIGVDHQLTLFFSQEYSEMSGIAEILSRAAIVKTLCQIKDIDYIEFYVNGQPLMKSTEQPIGFMTAEDFIDNTGAETNYRQIAYVCVYYANESGDRLKEAHLRIEFEGTRTQEQLVMEQLINGPIPELTGMYPTLSENTAVNKITTSSGICYVDLNSSFLSKLSSVTEEVAVYSVVNSLVELSSVNQVQITIDGKERHLYQSIDISSLLERKLELIEE